MNVLILILKILGAAALAPLFAAPGSPDVILPAPARVTYGEGPVVCGTPKVTLGGRAFLKATASLPAFARHLTTNRSQWQGGLRLAINVKREYK